MDIISGRSLVGWFRLNGPRHDKDTPCTKQASLEKCENIFGVTPVSSDDARWAGSPKCGKIPPPFRFELTVVDPKITAPARVAPYSLKHHFWRERILGDLWEEEEDAESKSLLVFRLGNSILCVQLSFLQVWLRKYYLPGRASAVKVVSFLASKPARESKNRYFYGGNMAWHKVF